MSNPGKAPALVRAIERLAALPEATMPTTHCGFELRDLGRLLERRLSKRA